MKLVIAEKPSVAVEIAKALNVSGRKNGYIQNNEWTITWCVGHLCTLKEPHDYDEKYKEWNLKDLPIIPKKYELKVVPATEDQYDVVSKLLQNNKFEFVVNATDAGREGELIFDNVYRLSGSKLITKRLWTSAALTEEAIRREFQNLKPASEFDGLRVAARVRAACDWLIGMNATRAVTLNVGIKGQVFTIGRVQTPTLSFIVQRELDIINFKPQEFWSITGVFSADKMSYNGAYKFLDKTGKMSNRIFDKEVANNLFVNLKKQKNGLIIDVEKENKKINPPSLLDLTNLQKEANKIYGFSAEETLNIAQKLYETHKVLSYPRTDYKCLPNEMKKEVKKILDALKKNGDQVPWFETAERNLNNKCDHIFDDSKVGDHHALIPMAKIPENLKENEQKIYDIVLKKLLASLNEEHIYETTQIITETSNQKFYSHGVVILKNGWKDIYNFQEKEDSDIPEDEQRLPAVTKGQKVNINEINIKNDKTKPQKRMTESDLLNCMQKPHLYMENEKLNEEQIDSLKQKGIGTPATRANVIKNLVDKKYVVRDKKTLFPTEKAIILIKNLEPEAIKSPIMTSKWEEKLVLIEEGKIKPAEFALEMNKFIQEVIDKSKNLSSKFYGSDLAKTTPKQSSKKRTFFKKKIPSIQSMISKL